MKTRMHVFNRCVVTLLLLAMFSGLSGCGGSGKLAQGKGQYGSISLSLRAAAQGDEIAYYYIDFYTYDPTTETAGTEPVIQTTRFTPDQTSVVIPNVPVGVLLLWIRGFNSHNENITYYKKIITVTTGVNDSIHAVMEPVNPGTGNNTIRGVVVDSAGHPVEDATVELVPVSSVTTPDTGTFQFTGVDDGTYTLRVTKPGHHSYGASVSVSGGEVENLGNLTINHESGIIADRSTCYGGTGNDSVYRMISTSDGGTLIVGVTSSDPPAGVTYKYGRQGMDDMFVVKLNADSQVEWRSCYGGDSNDYAASACETSDGYVIIGSTESSELNGFRGDSDFLLVKIGFDGTLQWIRCLGYLQGYDHGSDIVPMPDNSFLVTGDTNNVATAPTDFSSAVSLGGTDIVTGRFTFDSSGNVIAPTYPGWLYRLGGNSSDYNSRIVLQGNYSYIVADTYSDTGDAITHHNSPGSNSDILVIRFNNSVPTKVFSRCYGGFGNETVGSALVSSIDGNLFITGSSNTNDGSGDVTNSGLSGFNFWLFKLDIQTDPVNLSLLWNSSIGGNGDDRGMWGEETGDGSFLVSGNTTSAELPGMHVNGSNPDFLVGRLDAAKTPLWLQCYGGTDGEYGGQVLNGSDGSLVVSGTTYSSDGDVTGKYTLPATSNSDFWFLKLFGPGL